MRPRVDVFLQYYVPHVSGLTNMAAELAEYSAEAGFEVHVHCVAAQTGQVRLNGVEVHAYKKTLSLGRGIFSVQLLRSIWRLRARRTGVAHVHMPYPESFFLAWVLPRTWKILATYQCDAPLSGGVNSLIARALDWSHGVLIRRADFTVCSSADYAGYSRLSKVIAANHPVVIPVTSIDRAGGKPTFAIPGKRLVGFIGRPTFEKGIDVLLKSMEFLPDDVCLLFAGPNDGLTERLGYDKELASRLVSLGRIHAVGFLDDGQIADFYASLDAYVHPSINSFDAFGIVQVEAVSAGIPVAASNIPGVRTVVEATKLGAITKAGDSRDLARGILSALEDSFDKTAARAVLESKYLKPIPQLAYLELLEELSQSKNAHHAD